ncbi:hypothetical protein HNP46_006057 [Pseudomonas nitritireducens]|uniref:Uncharacterized protein n=1 Tax=Pseudomonas nitroreducens TaxID=46680 RepID=A0A7W7KQR3_PSENT|nr:hypothetical protein [Pseudomonas nitritireducens]MBB4867146.1 hypothetical protein [Pseudomonas nitritireducens]
MKKILPKELSAELEGFTSEQIRDGMRMYHPIDPGLYYDLLGNLGFDLIEDSFIEDHTLAEPSFFFASKIYAPEDGVPCYLGKISVAPLDSTDDLANRILEDVSDDIEGNGYGVGVVLWKSPTFKEYKGGTLQYFGRLYSDGVWHELLLKPGVKSIDELIDVTLKGFDVNDPGIAFKWSNSEPLIIYHAIETESPTNKHLLDNFEIMQIRGVSGWTSTLCGPKK